MKNLSNLILSLTFASVLAACGGGGGGGTGGSGGGNTGGGTYNPPSNPPYNPPGNGNYYSHNEVAAEFSRRLNIEVSGYDVTLVKTNTLSASYIVVYDRSYQTYDAYYVGAYTPGQDMALYLNRYETNFYYDLVALGNNNYKDFMTGRLFEIDDSASLNVEKVAAYKEMAAINKTAQQLREQYGMSEESSLETARFAVQLNNSSAGSVDPRAMDRFAQKLTGSTVTQFQKDIAAGNTESLQNRIEMAQEKTGMSDEGILKLFGQ
jgi:hypothetical protein